MSDLLSPEERSALQEPYAAARSGVREVTRAVFPSVGQLDPERTATLISGLKRWFEPVAEDLSRQLRLSCVPRPPQQQTIARGMLPPVSEEGLWTMIEGIPESYLLVSLPRPFAAAICERIFGAPFDVREDRTLAPAEVALMRDLIQCWLPLFNRAWTEHVVGPCSGPDPDESEIDEQGSNWIRFTSDFMCGPVEGAVSVTLPPFSARVLLGEADPGGSTPCSPRGLVSRLGDVPIELRAVLGQADFSLDELSSLRLGDVIALDRRAQDPVDIMIYERTFLRARAGVAGQLVAIELIGEPARESMNEH